MSGYEVTAIRQLNTKKKLVCLNGQTASFALYNSELRKYHIEPGSSITEEVYQEILTQVLYNRARSRALHIITRKDVSRNELRDKLADSYYPEEVINAVIECMEENRLVDDSRYADSYVWYKGDTRSRRQIEMYLRMKGIDDAIIRKACDDYYSQNEDAEEELIKQLIEKKNIDFSSITYAEKGKLMAYLARKGFNFDAIQRVVEQCSEDGAY